MNFWSALGAVWAALLGACLGDIVLSVATPTDMGSYLDVLSAAWPTLYAKLDAQLEVAQEQVPAEHSYLLSLLGVSAVPSEYDAAWAQQFVGNALQLGPTTVMAENIPNAADDPAAQPTDLLTTNDDGEVGVLEDVSVERPTIIVAVNGNPGRLGHNAASQSESESLYDGDDSTSGALARYQQPTAAIMLIALLTYLA
ncbi:hypothetical protein LPJ63_002902 [Coemansia sp. RSA 2711]|nr:hypothetical protein LPJ63_002902 [Coemansia sp. RSA 2711]KAJ1841639.1 hypothetical protein LPJ70_004148 [Coemansia sp. RSA 2708]KAJ2303868.1 hypothetical protein IWW54_005597 [Coemansia sp. RSA 2705]